MTWWWDNYIEPNNLYHHFAPVAAFAADVDWVQENYAPARADAVAYAAGDGAGCTRPSPSIRPGESWGRFGISTSRTPSPSETTASVSDLEVLSRVQHGLANHPTWHNPMTFEVNYPRPGASRST